MTTPKPQPSAPEGVSTKVGEMVERLLNNQIYVDKFWSKVDRRGDAQCWEWQGRRNRGYGSIFVFGKNTGAHRVSVMLSGREIPLGMHIDHLCRNPPCVNPSHLEVVTPRENALRGTSPAARNAAKDKCEFGHPLIEGNVYGRNQWRACLACKRRTTALSYIARKYGKNSERFALAEKQSYILPPDPKVTARTISNTLKLSVCKRGHDLRDPRNVTGIRSRKRCSVCASIVNKRYLERKRNEEATA